MDQKFLNADNTNEVFVWGLRYNNIPEEQIGRESKREVLSKKTYALIHSFLANQSFYKHIVRYRTHFLVSRGLSNEEAEKKIREFPEYNNYSVNPLEIVKIFNLDPDYPENFLMLCTTSEIKKVCVLLLLRPEHSEVNMMKSFPSFENTMRLYEDKETLVKPFIDKEFLKAVEKKFMVED